VILFTSRQTGALISVQTAVAVGFAAVTIYLLRTSPLPATMGGPFWFCVATFMLLLVVLLMLRVNLGKRQAALDELYLAYED